jgi:hypothetical protein
MSGAAMLVPTQAARPAAKPPADKPGLERRAALAAVIAESRGAVEAALRQRRSGERTSALALWRAEDRRSLQPRFVQLGSEQGDGSIRWGRAILLRAESHNPLYLAAKDRLLAEDAVDPAASVLDALAHALSSRWPCRVVDQRA